MSMNSSGFSFKTKPYKNKHLPISFMLYIKTKFGNDIIKYLNVKEQPYTNAINIISKKSGNLSAPMSTIVKDRNNLTELKVLTYITELGYSISIPFGDKDRYDQIWDAHGKLLRVQIKTSRWKTEQQKAIIFS